MAKKGLIYYFSFVMIACSLLLSACERTQKSLIVYSGQGMMTAMEDIKKAFEKKHGINIHLIYAGSNTLLSNIKNTQKGDIYIPGSHDYIDKAEDLIRSHRVIARHVPTFAVRKDNNKDIQSFRDLSRAGIRIAVGNKDMCSIGMTTQKILAGAEDKTGITNNIVINASTVVELFDLVANNEVDASLIWKDMLSRPGAQGLKPLPIPEEINIIKEIPVAVLSTTTDLASAKLFAEYVATEGKAIFIKNGFVD